MKLTYPCIFLWLLEECRKVFVAFLVLVTCLPPLGDCLAMEDQDVEESIQEENVCGLDGRRVE